MSFRFNISAGELFDLIRPAAYIISALISTLILASARRRFPLYQSILWALGALSFPLVVCPLYLIAAVLRPRSYVHSIKSRLAIPLVYATVVLAAIGGYQYLDNRSVDAHLARASQARVNHNQDVAINEYRQALEFEDDPHTHKLLAIQLADSGSPTEAISEFRLAQQGGEPDDSIHFWLGLMLERINLKGQARLEFEKFLLTPQCLRFDNRCEAARQKLQDAEQ